MFVDLCYPKLWKKKMSFYFCSCGKQMILYGKYNYLRMFSILILLTNLSSSEVLILLKE